MSVSNNPFVRTSRFRKTRPTTAFDTGSTSPYGHEATLNAIPAPTDQDTALAARYLTRHPDGPLFARMLGLDTASTNLEKG